MAALWDKTGSIWFYWIKKMMLSNGVPSAERISTIHSPVHSGDMLLALQVRQLLERTGSFTEALRVPL